MKRLVAFLFLLLLPIVGLYSDPVQFDNRVLFLLDEGSHTYLFRGKMPEEQGEFCYEALSSQFRNYLAYYGRQLSPEFDFLCVSFLNCSETKDRKVESHWFSNNCHKGSLWMYPLFGSWIDPRIVSPTLRKSVYACDPDGLQILMRQLKGLVDAGHHQDKDLVIYLHCHAGKDRTGEASACYLMQFKGFSHSQAVALCTEIAGRQLKRPSLNAIRWYAFYLRDVLQYRTIGIIN